MPVYPAGTRGDALRVFPLGVEMKTMRAVGGIPGVAVLAAAGANGPGTGYIRAQGDGTFLSWKAPGSSTYGANVHCASDGGYVLEDGEDASKWLRVSVYTSYLTPGHAEGRVYIADKWNTAVAYGDVTAAEASAGDVTEYQCVLQNDSPCKIIQLKCWLDASVSGLEISSDGVNYFTPDSEDHADVLEWASVAAGGSATLYVKRTIAADASSNPGVLNILHFSWTGI